MFDKILRKIKSLLFIDKILKNQNELKILLGKTEISNRKRNEYKKLNDHELKVFSQ